MNRRAVIAITLAAAAIVILAVGIATRRVTQVQPAVPTAITYTNSVTDSQANDIIGEITGLAPNVVVRSGVTIDGIDSMYPYLSTDQALNAQSIISDFLMARSGLTSVHAAIQGNTITQTENQISFTLVVMKPQISYQVLITIKNSYQTIPDVTINRIGV